MNWKKMIDRIRFDLSGATTVEYGLILAMIFLAMITGFRNFASAFQELWEKVTGIISAAIGG